MSRKPKGVLGPISAKVVAPDVIDVSFEQIHFPKGKDDTETFVVVRFLRSADKAFRASTGHPFFIANPRKNTLDDFDFDVDTPIGPAYLELMEVAPLEKTQGGYAGAPASYKPYEFAEYVTAKVMKKSAHYPTHLGRELFLLLYSTHWGFVPSKSTFLILRNLLLN